MLPVPTWEGGCDFILEICLWECVYGLEAVRLTSVYVKLAKLADSLPFCTPFLSSSEAFDVAYIFSARVNSTVDITALICSPTCCRAKIYL